MVESATDGLPEQFSTYDAPFNPTVNDSDSMKTTTLLSLFASMLCAANAAFALTATVDGVAWTYSVSNGGATLGAKGSAPCCGDFDGDGLSDFAAYAGSAKTPILYRMLSTSRWREVRSLPFGAKGSRTATGDWDGDGAADPAIESKGAWWRVTRDWIVEEIPAP